MKTVFFAAGKAFDASGRATPFWSGAVAYKWDCLKQAFTIVSTQVLGTGTVTNSRSNEAVSASLEEVNEVLDYFRDLQAHYKKVYGE